MKENMRQRVNTLRNFYYFCGESRAHIEPEFEKLKILSEYIIGFSEWLKEEGILK